MKAKTMKVSTTGHGAWGAESREGRTNGMKSKHSTIEADTVLLPEVIADTVAHELGVYLHDFHCYTPRTHPDHLVAYLVKRAEQIHAANKDFRKKLQSRGNKGRDTLYAFMRHWSAGYVKDNWPGAFELLPSGYKMGGDLPKKRMEI